MPEILFLLYDRRMRKNKITAYILAFLAFAALTALGVFLNRKAWYEDTYDSLTLIFSGSDTLEYGSSYNVYDFIKTHRGRLSHSGEADPMTPGDYEVIYSLEAEEERFHQVVRRDYPLTIHVTDTKPPVLELSKEEETVYVNRDFDYLSLVENVYDPVDGDIDPASLKVETDADLSQKGEYTVTITAADKNGLETKASYTLNVKEAPKRGNEAAAYIYQLLRNTYGYNSAAACGILANIYSESRFDPTNGTGIYYGLCQWGGGRRDRLFSWCPEQGLDPESIDGQIAFMENELTGGYKSVDAALREVEDSASGAYDAAIIFCTQYERAASTGNRGSHAMDFYSQYH